MAEAPGPNVPFPPMEAELVSELPAGGGWRYEPKWDGFRGVLENDGGELALWSRNGRPLLRYFPELRPLGELMPAHSALDGEIVIARDGALDFDAMQMRLHPAESRVRKLAGEIPATFVAFDLLLWKGKPVHERPIEKRRAELEKVGDGLRAVAGLRRSGARNGVAADAAGRRLRRRHREEARPPLPPRLTRRSRQGQAAQDGGLRRGRDPLEEGRPRDDRDTPARSLCRRRRAQLRRLGRGRREEPGRDRGQGAPARGQEERPPLQRAEPLGQRGARGDGA